LTKKIKPAARLPTNGLRNVERKGTQKSSSSRATFIPDSVVKNGYSYADVTRRNSNSKYNGFATQSVPRSINRVEDHGNNNKFAILEKAIQDINARMDQLFKLIQDSMDANKAFRDLVQKLITK